MEKKDLVNLKLFTLVNGQQSMILLMTKSIFIKRVLGTAQSKTNVDIFFIFSKYQVYMYSTSFLDLGIVWKKETNAISEFLQFTKNHMKENK